MAEPEKCGAPAGALIPRWGMSFACVLPKGHEGPHQRGGCCFRHGEYVGDRCPKWEEDVMVVERGTGPIELKLSRADGMLLLYVLETELLEIVSFLKKLGPEELRLCRPSVEQAAFLLRARNQVHDLLEFQWNLSHPQVPGLELLEEAAQKE